MATIMDGCRVRGSVCVPAVPPRESFPQVPVAGAPPIEPLVEVPPPPAVDVDALRREARSEGLVQGRAEAIAEMDGLRARSAAMCQALADARSAVMQGAEDQLVEMAFETLARALGESVVTREGLSALVARAIAQIRAGTRVLAVRISPHDLELFPAGAAFSGVEVRADPGVACGGCIVETDHGALDARLIGLLERVREVLLAARRERSETTP